MTSPFINQRKLQTNKSILLNEIIWILRSEDKQTADSPCEEIRISGEIENEAKAYKAFRSRNVSFRPQNVSFRSQSVSFCPRSVPFRANCSAFLWCSSTLQGLYLDYLANTRGRVLQDTALNFHIPDWIIIKQTRQIGIKYGRGVITIISIQSEKMRFQGGYPLQAFPKNDE